MHHGKALLAVGLAILAAWTWTAVSSAQTDDESKLPMAVRIQEGIYAEQTEDNLERAAEIYRGIITEARANDAFVAQAHYRLGEVLLKKGERREATRVLKVLVERFPDQRDLVAKAQEALARAGSDVSEAEIVATVRNAVRTISTCTEADPAVATSLRSLKGLSDDVIAEALIEHLGATEDVVRRAAIYVAWRGPMEQVHAALPKLRALMGHNEDLTRGMAALALGQRQDTESLSALQTMATDDRSGYSRRCAAYALGLLGDDRARSTLLRAMRDEDHLVRGNARRALTMLEQAKRSDQPQTPADLGEPIVVTTTPMTFANDVDPSLAAITATFTRRMTDANWSWTGGGETFPKITGQISYDADRTTCTMPVHLEPGHVYWVGVNSPINRNFKSDSGRPARRYVILFATAGANGEPTAIPAELIARAKEINARAFGDVTAEGRLEAEDLAAKGWQLWGQHELAEAEDLFAKAAAADPSSPNAYNGLGWSQLNQGKTSRAARAFERCVAIDPAHSGALNGLGWIARSAGETQRALNYWLRAVRAQPGATAALNGLTITYTELGNHEQTAKYWRMWLDAEPDNQRVQQGLRDAEQAARDSQ